MKMIRAIIRTEMCDKVTNALMENGYPAMTKMDVYGRGKQKGLQIGTVFYDELPKQMLLIVVHDEDEEIVSKIILENAYTGDDGNYGDGRIFVNSIEKAYTISSKTKSL